MDIVSVGRQIDPMGSIGSVSKSVCTCWLVYRNHKSINPICDGELAYTGIQYWETVSFFRHELFFSPFFLFSDRCFYAHVLGPHPFRFFLNSKSGIGVGVNKIE